MVVAPSGKILAEAGMDEEIVSLDIDLAAIDKVRARMHAQMSDTDLCKKADLILVNDGTHTISELADQAEVFIKNL